MNQTQCIAAEASVLDFGYNIVRSLHLFFGIIVLLMLVRLVWTYKTKSVYLHKNFIIILFKYKNSCDCLLHVWLVYVIRIPAFLYVAGSPLFHFSLMIERILATIYVKIYENQGKIIGVISTIIVVEF
uniref:7TM_GPCR_Srx domain-containing protein n=1 Tax=Meloidogyne hapla TaxID=6305 RepID=A0A1I8BPC4_MELHA